MSFWRQAPLFRLLLPFVGGIIAGIFIPHDLPGRWIIISVLLLFLFILFFWKRLYIRYRNRHLFGVVLAISLAIMGYVLTLERTELYHTDHYKHHYSQGDWVLAEVSEAPVEKARSHKIVLEVKDIKKENSWVRASGHILVYLQKDSIASKVKYGDLLILNRTLKEIEAPKNPSEFNYKRYLGFHNINYQSYLPSGSWMIMGEGGGWGMLRWAHSIRTYFLDIFRFHGIDGDEFAVASALILGYKDDLDKGLVRAYSSAGATHILAVSGLHVGIIYMVLDMLLRVMNRNRYTKIWKAILLILMLWFYATLTGLSPSVLRAATMFSFVIIGKATSRSTNIYNTLAASAFFLLLINPFLVTEVGFQLSYLAVLGIVFLQPKLYHLLDINNWALDKMWAITTVSISAQLATFPLALLYFHQFPNYFLISNLLVIPLAAIILYLGILIFITSFFDPVCYLLAKALDYVIWFLNHSVRLIETLPYSITERISINIAETWAIYMFIAFSLAFITLIRLSYLRVALISLIGLSVWQGLENYFQSKHKKFIVYNVNREAAYDLIDGRTNYFISQKELFNDVDKMLFHVKHNWWDMGLNKTVHIDLKEQMPKEIEGLHFEAPFLQFKGMRIAMVDTTFRERQLDLPIKVDYVILSGGPKISLELLKEQFSFRQLIIDSSNPNWRTEIWLKEANELGIPCHAVSKNGAFVRDV